MKQLLIIALCLYLSACNESGSSSAPIANSVDTSPTPSPTPVAGTISTIPTTIEELSIWLDGKYIQQDNPNNSFTLNHGDIIYESLADNPTHQRMITVSGTSYWVSSTCNFTARFDHYVQYEADRFGVYVDLLTAGENKTNCMAYNSIAFSIKVISDKCFTAYLNLSESPFPVYCKE